jgi:predicted lipid-binding transport protein (Tim44 family)
MIGSRSRLGLALIAALTTSLVVAEPADARRGGSFGSRGMRTYSAPRATTMTPGYVPPVQRSMTPNTGAGFQPGYQAGYRAPAAGYGSQYQQPAPRRGLGFGGGLAAGLIGGGLLGAMLGHGWGGGWGGFGGMGGFGAGMLSTLFQLALIGVLIWLAMRLFRRRQPPALAGVPNGSAYEPAAGSPWGAPREPERAPWGASTPWGQSPAQPANDLRISPTDEREFERLLTDVQDAFGREDYAGLRARATPEIMSYLAEELSDNATHGRRNEVRDVRLLRSEVSEAWSEAEGDYATVALDYESIDVMRDRQTGQVLQGDPDRPTRTTELWTFVRRPGEGWKLSAIQES